MIQHTYERARQASCLTDVIVATDDERIAAVVQAFGGKVLLTGKHHLSGTDRLAEVAESLTADILVNIQGDEPLITPDAIETVVNPLMEDDTLPMSTLAHRIDRVENLFNPHMGKVVFDRDGIALYFSRSPIPYPAVEPDDPDLLKKAVYYNTVGVYAYRREFLLTFAALNPTPLERAERLEQLRALEHGYRIGVRETDYAPLGVDVPGDLLRVEQRLTAGEGAL